MQTICKTIYAAKLCIRTCFASFDIVAKLRFRLYQNIFKNGIEINNNFLQKDALEITESCNKRLEYLTKPNKLLKEYKSDDSTCQFRN